MGQFVQKFQGLVDWLWLTSGWLVPVPSSNRVGLSLDPVLFLGVYLLCGHWCYQGDFCVGPFLLVPNKISPNKFVGEVVWVLVVQGIQGEGLFCMHFSQPKYALLLNYVSFCALEIVHTKKINKIIFGGLTNKLKIHQMCQQNFAVAAVFSLLQTIYIDSASSRRLFAAKILKIHFETSFLSHLLKTFFASRRNFIDFMSFGQCLFGSSNK